MQWELYIGKVARPDIVVYNRFSSTTTEVYPVVGVEVIEAKVKGENAAYGGWPGQLNNQILALQNRQMTNVHPGTILNVLSPGGVYTDTFQVWDDTKGDCKVASGNAGYALKSYVAKQPGTAHDR